jgi:hypothetical protein
MELCVLRGEGLPIRRDPRIAVVAMIYPPLLSMTYALKCPRAINVRRMMWRRGN